MPDGAPDCADGHRTPRPLHPAALGDARDPDAVTAALGCAPSRGWRKGDRRVFPKPGRVAIERTGGWALYAEDRDPEDLPRRSARCWID